MAHDHNDDEFRMTGRGLLFAAPPGKKLLADFPPDNPAK